MFSLPADIKTKTIYTVVTKPVRPGEIVLGRIVGFSLVGNDRGLINSKIDKMFNLAEELGLAEVVDTEMELIPL